MNCLSKALLAGALTLQAGCASFKTCPDSWWGPDKFQHFAFAAAIGAGSAAAASSRFEPEEAAGIGLAVATLAGTGKEWRDLNVKKTCWSWKDLAWDVLGASAGASIAWALE